MACSLDNAGAELSDGIFPYVHPDCKTSHEPLTNHNVTIFQKCTSMQLNTHTHTHLNISFRFLRN